MNDLNERYFNWMMEVLDANDLKYESKGYTRLINKMIQTPYNYILPMDENRMMDGIDLKYTFAYENGISYSEINEHFNNSQASLLEVIIALSIRCMEGIIGDTDNRGLIFWNGLKNMGLISMDDLNYKEAYVNDVINAFIHNNYEPNGRGGLFMNTEKFDRDMRNVELWAQAMWYLDSLCGY